MTQQPLLIKLPVELPTTSDLFKKHFNDMGQAGLFHKNAEVFFDELNQVCQMEDAIKELKTHSYDTATKE